MAVAATGLACLGAVICFISMFFIVRLKTHTVSALGAVLGVVLGGAVGKFLTANTHQQDAIWWYPIGMVIGLVLWIAVRFLGALAVGMPGLGALLAKLK